MPNTTITYQCPVCKLIKKYPADLMGVPDCRVCGHRYMEEIKELEASAEHKNGA